MFSNKTSKKPGPKGLSDESTQLVVEIKRRNPRFGYLRIALKTQEDSGIKLDKGVVRRILAKHHKPTTGENGPFWLTFIGHMNDSLWSVDFFRC